MCVTTDSHIYLIDGSAYIYRAYYAMFKAAQVRGINFTRSDGTPTGAVMTFCRILFKVVREGLDEHNNDKPTHIAVIFDHKGQSFRAQIYPEYKLNRSAPPNDLILQFPLIREAVRAFGFTPIEQKGYEADDLIATYVTHAREIGARVTIISGDKDLMQLINQGVRMFDPLPGKERRIDIEDVKRKFGVEPNKVVDVQALAGDTSDNVPGVPGIGIKIAAQLIREFGDLETLLKNIECIKQKKRRENLIKFSDQARLSRRLVLLDTQVPLNINLQDLDRPKITPEKLIAFSKAMEFTAFTKYVAEVYNIDIDIIDSDTKYTVVINSCDVSEIKKSEAISAYYTNRATEFAVNRSLYETVVTAESLKQWVFEAYEIGYIAFDTETTSLNAMQAELVGFSLSTRPGKACYVPVAHCETEERFTLDKSTNFVQMDLEVALSILKPLLEDRSVLKIGQNIKYDMILLHRYNIKLKAFDDTMLMSYVLDGGLRGHGIEELAQRHLQHTCISFKEVITHAPGRKVADKSFAEVPIDKATLYAAEDADVTMRLWLIFRARLISERMTTVYETLERPLVPVIVDMEQSGIAVDSKILMRLSTLFAKRAAKLEEDAYSLAGERFNLGSPRQLGTLLFDKLKLPGGKKTKSGQWETRATLLDDLSCNKDLPDKDRKLVHIILEWRQMTKLRSTYTDALPMHINPVTNRIHTSYSLAATTTGRLASTDPNLQNIPVRTTEGREIRTAFISEKGKKLVSADYSQVELRVLAHVADIPQLRRAFDEGLDIHAMTASEMFGVSVYEMPSDVRRRAKAINFGIIYGISAFGLANQLGITREVASNYIRTYFERFPGIKKYMEVTKETAKAKGYVETLFGRKIHYSEINIGNSSTRGFYERSAINAPIQGSAADIIRRAMIRMPLALKEAGVQSARMLMQVHDELIFEVAETEADKLKEIARKVMEKAPEPAINFSVPLKVDINMANNWEAAH
ncbi:MAG: DNA polymerase I [Hyphomicrobiaceae bacterium hypho_1]